MDEIIGFIVLTSPLWLILLSLVIGIWAAFIVARRFKSGSAKIAAAVGVSALIFLVLFGDALAGRAYHDYLCSNKAGVKIYHVTQLPTEYWDADGRAKYLKSNGDLDETVLGSRITEAATTMSYTAGLGIDIRRRQVVDTETRKTLGEVINFLYWGGWIARNLSVHPSATDCAHLHGNDFWEQFHLSLFRQA